MAAPIFPMTATEYPKLREDNRGFIGGEFERVGAAGLWPESPPSARRPIHLRGSSCLVGLSAELVSGEAVMW